MAGSLKQFYQLGSFVKNRRLQLGLTQIQLSNLMGYKSGQLVSNLERGLSGIPFEKVGLMASILKVSNDTIIDQMVEDFRINVKDNIESEDGYELQHANGV
jgi:transcriptional regulator with XRE-family HTH domain